MLSFVLASFTWPSIFKVHPCCGIYQYFIPFYGWMLFCCVDLPHIVNHSLVCGHLRCFCFLATINNHVWFFVWTYVFDSLGFICLVEYSTLVSVTRQMCCWPFTYFFEEMSIQVHILIGLFVFCCCCWVVRILYIIRNTRPLYIICKYFLTSCGLSFNFLYSVLWSVEICNFGKIWFICFFLWLCMLLSLHPRNHCLTQYEDWYEDLFLWFLLRVLWFYHLHLCLWSILS